MSDQTPSYTQRADHLLGTIGGLVQNQQDPAIIGGLSAAVTALGTMAIAEELRAIRTQLGGTPAGAAVVADKLGGEPVTEGA